MASLNRAKSHVVEDPPLARLLFSDTRLALLWLLVRVYVGWQWLDAGLHKLQTPAWIDTGAALKGFWTSAVAIPEAPARPAIAYEWYRGFLQMMLEGGHYTWFAKVVVFGEILVGVGLIVGAFVGVAALFGAFLNFNFMLAGSASVNPVLLVLAIGLLVAWKVAGHYGLDRYLLPVLGTPWDVRDKGGREFKEVPSPRSREAPGEA
jgi:thiosulfate dehydrogenase (quinone) large subunit